MITQINKEITQMKDQVRLTFDHLFYKFVLINKVEKFIYLIGVI